MFFSKHVRVLIWRDDPERHQVFKTCHLSFSFLTANHHHHYRLALSLSGHFSLNVSNNVLPSHTLTNTKNYTFNYANSSMTVAIIFEFDKFKSTSYKNYVMISSSCAWRLKMVGCRIHHLNFPISNLIMFQHLSPFTNSTKIDHSVHSIPCKLLGNMSNPIFVSVFMLFYPLCQDTYYLNNQIFEFYQSVHYIIVFL